MCRTLQVCCMYCNTNLYSLLFITPLQVMQHSCNVFCYHA